MMSEHELNTLFQLILCLKPRPLDNSVIQQIDFLLSFYRTKYVENEEIPLMVRNKFDLLVKLCDLFQQGATVETAIASTIQSEKYKQHKPLLEMMIAPELAMNEDAVQTRVKFINDLVTWCDLSGDSYKKLSKYVEMVKDATFDSIQDVIHEWTDIIKGASRRVAEYELTNRQGLMSSLNTKGNYIEDMVAEIRKKYSPKNVITSGIPELDADFLGGGFQPSRFYLWSGTSGVEKSIILLNSAIRAALSKATFFATVFTDTYDADSMPPEQVFLYVTMENFVYETWLRLYCSMTQTTKADAQRLLLSNPDAARFATGRLNEQFRLHRSSIQIEYFPPHTITPSTISGLIHKYSGGDARKVVKGVYIDYLDLMKPNAKSEFYRLDLGQITSGLKTVAATHEIPVITATQLNREAYKKVKVSEIGPENVSESIQKLLIADFSATIVRDMQDEKDRPEGEPIKLSLRVNKNRDGKTGEVAIYMDYLRSRFMTREEFDAKCKSVMEI